MVAGEPPSDVKEGDQVFVAYIGNYLFGKDVDSDEYPDMNRVNAKGAEAFETQIQLLKNCNLLKQIGDAKVTTEVIMKAIEALNKECEQTLGKMVNVVRLKSGDHLETRFYQRQPYCEDERLSVACTGTPFLGLAVERDSVPTLTPSLLQMWIDFCASFLNVEGYDPKGPSEKKTKQIILARIISMNLKDKVSSL